MKISVKKYDRYMLFSLKGKLDALATKEFQQKLIGEWSDHLLCLILDLQEIEYLSSAGLRVMLSTYKRLQGRSGALILCNLQPSSLETMRFTGFLGAFPRYDSVEKEIGRAHV